MVKLISRTRNKGGEIMAIKVTNKKPLTGNKRSHALNATKKQQKPNLQVVTLDDGTKVRMSTREIRNMRKQQAVVAEEAAVTEEAA
jgi:large subunit ribosomal protein L28